VAGKQRHPKHNHFKKRRELDLKGNKARTANPSFDDGKFTINEAGGFFNTRMHPTDWEYVKRLVRHPGRAGSRMFSKSEKEKMARKNTRAIANRDKIKLPGDKYFTAGQYKREKLAASTPAGALPEVALAKMEKSNHAVDYTQMIGDLIPNIPLHATPPHLVSSRRAPIAVAKWTSLTGLTPGSHPVSVGVATSTVSRQGMPHVSSGASGSTRVIHSEFIGDVNSGEFTDIDSGLTLFEANTYDLNVGIKRTFEWLSTFAKNFTFYEVNNMVFHYVTRSGTGVAGSVMLAIEPNSMEPAPEDERATMTYPGAVEFVPWDTGGAVHFDHRRYAPAGKRYVRYEARGGDPRLYDFGKLVVATSGCTQPVNAVLGKLFVAYDVTLSSPQFDTTTEFSTSAMSVYASTANIPVPPTSYLSIPFRIFGQDDSGRDINPLRITSSFTDTGDPYSRDYLTIPSGNYKISWTFIVYNTYSVSLSPHGHLSYWDEGADPFVDAGFPIAGSSSQVQVGPSALSTFSGSVLIAAKAERKYAYTLTAGGSAGPDATMALYSPHAILNTSLIIELVA
jgi:hypothetical protein